MSKNSDHQQKNRHDEDLLCIAFNDHLKIYFPKLRGKLNYTHIANQGRSAAMGGKLKKMGVTPGWFDYVFLSYTDILRVIFLEAKVHGRDYIASQETFDYMTEGMPIFKGKFYTVREGHYKLIEAGVRPFRPCSYFKEPDYRTFADHVAQSHLMFAPRKDAPAPLPE